MVMATVIAIVIDLAASVMPTYGNTQEPSHPHTGKQVVDSVTRGDSV